MSNKRRDTAMDEKLYIIVRKDLPYGAQFAQAIHAVAEFAIEYNDLYREWHSTTNTVVVLSVKDETELLKIQQLSIENGIAHSLFREPDYSGSATSIALKSKKIKFLNRLKLANL